MGETLINWTPYSVFGSSPFTLSQSLLLFYTREEHADPVEVPGTAQNRVLLSAVVSLQNQRHHYPGGHTKNIHQQNSGSTTPQLLGEAKPPQAVLPTKKKKKVHNHIHMENSRKKSTKRGDTAE